jgi:carbon monoxide dehydrogenase subunit G
VARYECQQRITILAPQETVWAFLIDPANMPLWRQAFTDPEPVTLALGQKLAYKVDLKLAKARSVEEIIAFEPPRLITLRIATAEMIRAKRSPFMNLTLEVTLEPVWGETRVNYRQQGETKGLIIFTTPVLRWRLSRIMTQELTRLKQAIENSAAPAP